MKKLSSILLSLTALVIIMGLSFACQSCQKPDPAPVPNPTAYTVSFNANGGTGSVASQTVNSGSSITLPSNSFSYTGYTFVSWNTNQSGTGTSYNAGASYTVTSNVTLYAIWQQNAPTYTAVFTAVDASSTASIKKLVGNEIFIFSKVNVTSSGSAKLETIGSLSNGNPSIAYYWITSRDSAEIFQSASLLNPLVGQTALSASQTITLPLGINVICAKVAAFNGAITDGTVIGLKLTGANGNTVANASYTADAVSANGPNAMIVKHKVISTGFSANTRVNGVTICNFTVKPFSDENATIYAANLYPTITALSFDTKNTSLFTGDTTGYSKLDFSNFSGQNYSVGDDNNGVSVTVFDNSNASFSNNTLQFLSTNGTKLTEAWVSNYADVFVGLNVYNNGPKFGPINGSWKIKNIRFTHNFKMQIIDATGNILW